MQISKESWIMGAIGLVIGLLFGGNGPVVNFDVDKSTPNQEQHMESAMNSMMMSLEGKMGDEFDQAFLSEMIIHHRGAVEMAEAVLENSQRKELHDLANDIIEAQTREINMMQMWQEEWR